MIWIALILLIVFLHLIGRLNSALSISYYVFFLSLGMFFIYLGYDAQHQSLTAPLMQDYRNPLFADYFSKEALIKEANKYYTMAFVIIAGTFLLPELRKK